MLLDYILTSERFAAAAPKLRRAAAVYAPSFFAPYVLAAAIVAESGENGRRAAEGRVPAVGQPGGAGWLVVAPDGEAAAKLAAELGVYLQREVPVLPARGVLYGADVAPAAHVVGERQQALAALAAGGVVVAEAVALLERFVPLELQPRPVAFRVGEEVSAGGPTTGFDVVVRRLADLGYDRVEHQVRERGEFAVRGGLIDVYPALGDPLRIEFWGDEVDTIRTFSVYSQRTTGSRDEATVFAAFEADTDLPEYKTGMHQAISGWEAEGREEAPDDLYRRAGVRALAALAGRFTTLEQLVAEGGQRIAVFNPDEVVRALADFGAELDTVFSGRDGGERGAEEARGARERLYVPLAQARALLAETLHIDLVQRDQSVRFEASRPQLAARDLAGAERDLVRLVRDGYRVFVVFRHEGEAERATYRLRNLSAEVLTAEQLERHGAAAPGLYFVAAPLREGFLSAELKLAVVPERSLLRGAARERRFVGGARLATFFDVRPGDYVVHEDHGIARFAGIETRTVAGITRDYLLLEYKGEDRVFVPHEQIGKVSRYIGAGAGAPPLNRLGGTGWATVKTRARRAVVEMAGELLQLYAARQAVPGYTFPPDGELMRRLEDAFPFEETEDQAETIDDVKNDMEAPHPMDRLVCGDVGYGKTEVAVRAALKAAEAGKQTLMLVPTTILAEQHHMTFGERFNDLPVTVEMVSRFRTAAEQRRILADFAAGKVDVLVGTHRLLSTDVQPKDLGLVIVDEEQRFGVRQKELLRNLKLQVDVMSLSATPIPRTLQMSLSGIRDISVIETPPRGRHEIHTYIGEYRDELVRIAIEKELAREGQVFYLHNRVETIDGAAEHVRELAPRARVLVAHGQMNERALETVMLSFLAGEADVLVTTSIIESGIDIPTANTLIVERADMLGLAQLYQIRGRIGRSDAHAYAYLLYPSEELLTSEAAARLTTLSDHTDLGAGFKIAMADLEIRGAGDLLGDEQSGHVAAVGFEMYAQMLEEAVNELRGEQVTAAAPVRVDLPVTAYVPPEYIAYEATKIDVHRRISRAASLSELGDVEAELTDRFGPPPEPVANLLALQAIRIKAAELGATAVTGRGGRVQVDGLELDDAWATRLRQGGGRVVYLKQKKSLAAHREGGGHETGGPPAAAAPECRPALAPTPASHSPAAAAPAGGPASESAGGGPASESHAAPPSSRTAASAFLRWVEATIDAIIDARASDP
ncbi:MAG TPA: transcription-repair coupling factor [Thermoleophilia bacterium]|nr:transcription-repair coupling factor [Thermoleophilia bacterium]HQJ97677.1 transcription-repair coupling factor [Thermoleophilia bacterium]